ncbi:MAG: hypothetical protein Q7R47_01050, partial [Candidatus Diapherotrites archaeon]|nr:hypothetical protein [Candidatus Diapherotrites archaeon]
TNGGGPPPYVEPSFDEEVFSPVVKLGDPQKIPGFDALSHVERMKVVDKANEVFRFTYATDRGGKKGETYYYKVPLHRNYEAHPEKIRVRITKRECDRGYAIVEAAGEIERIVRAIPYYGLYTAVKRHLREDYGVGLDDIVLVSVDRGGRIPCIVLQRALGLPTMHSLKVDQGGSGVDNEKLEQFAAEGTLRGKHVLFVDSTVDSGRQIEALKRHFDTKTMRTQLGFTSWSIVGSNDHNRNLSHHQNVDWGVDPDGTFEDKPSLMGIDYAPHSRTKVVDCPSQASEAIRRHILAVPNGMAFDFANVDRQIKTQFARWKAHQRERLKEHRQEVFKGHALHREEVRKFREERKKQSAVEKFENRLGRIVTSKRWRELRDRHQHLPVEQLPEIIPNGTTHAFHNILVVGRGTQNLPDVSARFLADNLGSHCSFFAGTPDGNPGAVLRAALASTRITTPEVRLYQPEHARGSAAGFGGFPVTFVDNKDDMRRQMIADAHAVLVLGGAEGTLREVLLSFDAGKPVVIIRGYGPVATYVLGTKRLASRSNCIVVENLRSAAEKILSMSSIP